MKKKIGVAVLGLGNMGGTHVQVAKASPYVNRIIGYEPDGIKAKKREQELNIPVTTDLDSILKDPSINLICIASPNEFHSLLAIQALKAGKAVFCEKPMAETLDKAKEILDAEKETGGFIEFNFEARNSRLYARIKEWIDSRLIGQVLNIHCDYFCSEFHLKNSWRSNSPGTLIGEKLCHYLDLSRWWVGDEVAEVYSLHAPNFVTYFNHPDNHNIIYKFRNGSVATLNFIMGVAETFTGDPLMDVLARQADDGHRLNFMICGTKGAIEADVFRRRLRRWEFTDDIDKLKSKIVETVTWQKDVDLEWFHDTHGHVLIVAERVAKGLKPSISAQDSFNTMRLGFAAEISEKERRIVQIS